jgi:membrane protease YdiL (CAAX protease family)
MDQAATERPRTPIQLTLAALGPLIAIGVMQLPVARLLFPGHSRTDELLRELVPWAVTIFVILWVLLVERQSLASIGLRMPDRRSLRLAGWTAAFISAVMVIQFFIVLPLLSLTHAAEQRQHILELPWWMRFLTVVRAAVTEEIIYRGLTIERVLWLTRSKAAALIISVIAFAAAHMRGWGATQLVPVALGGVALGLLYLARRSLPANMLAHFITDAAGFLFG